MTPCIWPRDALEQAARNDVGLRSLQPLTGFLAVVLAGIYDLRFGLAPCMIMCGSV